MVVAEKEDVWEALAMRIVTLDWAGFGRVWPGLAGFGLVGVLNQGRRS